MRLPTTSLLLLTASATTTVLGSPVRVPTYIRRAAATVVKCAPVDKDGTPLLSSSVVEPGDFAECTYKDAGLCTYFAGNGSFSSGSSTCPAGIPQDLDFEEGMTTAQTKATQAPPLPPPPPPPPKTTKAVPPLPRKTTSTITKHTETTTAARAAKTTQAAQTTVIKAPPPSPPAPTTAPPAAPAPPISPPPPPPAAPAVSPNRLSFVLRPPTTTAPAPGAGAGEANGATGVAISLSSTPTTTPGGAGAESLGTGTGRATAPPGCGCGCGLATGWCSLRSGLGWLWCSEGLGFRRLRGIACTVRSVQVDLYLYRTRIHPSVLPSFAGRSALTSVRIFGSISKYAHAPVMSGTRRLRI
ncbi:hypothetical protein B0H11DRAFT_2309422 [Mycena galericulata]|nr:hypothetical protein B0H11DRAFT_2309422 [Mycena galericulata]